MILNQIHGRTPVVMFIGPPACGKSMVLQSLLDFLRHKDCTFGACEFYLYSEPTPFFSAAQRIAERERDMHELQRFQDKCDAGIRAITYNIQSENGLKEALSGSYCHFPINVCNNDGKPIIRFLDAPGEEFFYELSRPVSDLILRILKKDRSYPVYYVVFLDLYSKRDGGLTFSEYAVRRHQYAERILSIVTESYCEGDKIILLDNKSDLNRGDVKTEEILEKYYPELKQLSKLRKKLFGASKLKVLPYISGCNFHERTDPDGFPHVCYSVDQECRECAQALWTELNPKKSIWESFKEKNGIKS